MSFYLNPTNTFQAAANVLAELNAPQSVPQYAATQPHPIFQNFALPIPAVMAAVATSHLQSSQPAAAASSLGQRNVMAIDVEAEEEIQSHSKFLERAKNKLATLKTMHSAGLAGIQSLGAQIEQLKAKMEETQKKVSQYAEEIEDQEPKIKMREEILTALREPKKKVDKRKWESDSPEPNIRAASASTLNVEEEAVKKQRMTSEESVEKLPLLLPLHQAAASSSSAAALPVLAPTANAAESVAPLAPPIPIGSLGTAHNSTDRVLTEVYIPGTVVLYKGKEATIQRYNKESNEFIVKQGGEEYSASKRGLVYIPKVGQKVLLKEEEAKDFHRRLYVAEVIKVEKNPAGVGVRKNTHKIQVKWLDFNSAQSNFFAYESLDKLLPLKAEDPITDKLKYSWVNWTGQGMAKGYFLDYVKQASSAT